MEGSLQFLEQAGKVMTAVDWEMKYIRSIYFKNIANDNGCNLSIWETNKQKTTKKTYKPTSWVNS